MQIKWWQTHDSLQLTFHCTGVEGEPSKREVSDDALTFEWGAETFSASFLKSVMGISARWQVKLNGKCEVEIRKSKGNDGEWARPFDAKVANVTADWDKWVEEEDYDSQPTKPPLLQPEEAQQLASTAKAITGGTEAPPGMPPALKDVEVASLHAASSVSAESGAGDAKAVEGGAASHAKEDAANGAGKGDGKPNERTATESTAEAAWLVDWREKLSPPQRMVTMALLWNEESHDVRQASAKRLMSILRGGDATAAEWEAKMKGGDVGSLKLDTSVYDSVPRPSKWIREFKGMEAEKQVETMATMFQALVVDEQKMVVSTFM